MRIQLLRQFLFPQLNIQTFTTDQIMLAKLTKFVKFKFSSNQNPVQQFLNSAAVEFAMIIQKGRGKYGNKINVPHKPVQREKVVQFFEKHSLKQKNIILDVDPSHIIGTKRLLVLEHLKTNVYQGVQQPVDMLSKHNPSNQVSLQQIFFDADYFFMTDSKFADLYATQQDEEKIDDIITEFYNNNRDRGVERLRQQYKVPQQFLYIAQTAHNLDNKIYFAGINQYEFRNIIWAFYSLDQLKQIYMKALHYWKNHKYFSPQKHYQLSYFNNTSRQFLYKEANRILQVIHYQRLKSIRAQIPHSYTFAHSYAFVKPQESLSVLMSEVKSSTKDSQSDKLQKHAILEVMLGDLWTQQYTMNRFPYLGESFWKLNESDKESVQKIYNKHFNLYLRAVQKFLQKQNLKNKAGNERSGQKVVDM